MTRATDARIIRADHKRRERVNKNRLKYPTMPDEVLGHADCDEIVAEYDRYTGGGSLGAFLAGWNAAQTSRIRRIWQ